LLKLVSLQPLSFVLLVRVWFPFDEGVSLFLSQGVLTRPFCLFEIKTAMQRSKKMVLMHETDARHGAFDFGEASPAPPDIANIVETHESLPWRRRRFEQDGILAELIKNSGLTAPSAAEAVVGAGVEAARGFDSVKAVGTDASSTGPDATSGVKLAPIADTVPVTPDAFSPRENDVGKLPRL
jgi:hypothetical protein